MLRAKANERIKEPEVAALVFPKSLALIGPSARNPAPIVNAQRGDIPVWGVHPTRSEVLGLRCVPDVDELAGAPEVAALLVSHSRIEAALDDAIAAGIRSFVIPGLGSEAGSEAAETARRVADRIRAANGTMLGPNCMGVARPNATCTWLGPLPGSFCAGHVAAIVQSGSIGEALVALGPRIGFRVIVSCGGEAISTAADFVHLLAEDDKCKAIALFLETVRDPAAFGAALRRAAEQGKPVVCLKVGRSGAAARTALAHTGALVGSHSAFSALLRQHGALEVRDLPELTEILEVLGRRRWPRGVRTAAVSESGGEAALLADLGEEHGLEFGPLPSEMATTLTTEFETLKDPQNPLDAWAIDAPERIYPRSISLLAGSGAFDVVLAQVDLSRFRGESDQAWNEAIVRALGRETKRPEVFGAVTSSHTTDPPAWAHDLAREMDIALLRGARDATSAIARVARWRPRLAQTPEWRAPIDIGDLVPRAGALSEHESAAILERYGIKFAPRRRAVTPEQAAAAAAELRKPVVVKADGPVHKSSTGGVVLNVLTPHAAAAAARKLGGAVLVAEQVARGSELICGMARDTDYGPILVVGRGGTDVDASASLVSALGPLAQADARALVNDAGVDDPDHALATIVEAVGRLAAEHPEVGEIDINPVIVNSSGLTAVDALVVIDEGEPTHG
jgi:acyl-CoA synthetase (NDP forming)